MKSNVEGWTDGRFRSFIVSALRAAFRRYPPKFAVLKNAALGKRINKATGKEAMHYKCAKCKKAFVAKQVQVDHIDPIVDPVEGFVSWEKYIERLFCTIDNLQVLCVTCHKKKTAAEKVKRKK